jgi:hypothetical protein
MKKTDNGDLSAKINLRKYFLDKYHQGKFSVFECCQGEQKIWGKLKKLYLCDVWGVDLKPKKGRLKLDSERYLAKSGWQEDVIDIDTYGSPWDHFFAMLPNVSKPVTCFLTIGNTGLTKLSPNSHGAKHIKFPSNTPPSLVGKVMSENDVSLLLPRCYDYAIIVAEALRCRSSSSNAVYIGLRLQPSK